MVSGKESLMNLSYTTIVRDTMLSGQLHVAVDSGKNDMVIGTACWYPPGTDFLGRYVRMYIASC